jgi:ATP-binding protein involved in chromosome partitioning
MAALGRVKDPELFKDIVTLNMVKGVRIEGDDVSVHIELTTPACPMKDVIQRDVERALRDVGARNVHIDWSANTRGQQGGPAGSGGAGAQGGPKRDVLPQVKNVIAVGAGKGGVGKSTIAANLAVGLARSGAQVGLMDGDIYGPSMPTILGIKGVAPEVRGGRILPHRVHGIHAITIGSLVEQDKPLIWRGPMAHGAFKQLLLDNTEWPELDYLIVDLPPGTGDVPLSLAQAVELSGAIVVTQPPRVAAAEALKAARMFTSLDVPVLGIVENMSGPFGHGGGIAVASELDVPFLGDVPFDEAIVRDGDSGTPTMVARASSLAARRFDVIAERVAAALGWSRLEPAA